MAEKQNRKSETQPVHEVRFPQERIKSLLFEVKTGGSLLEGKQQSVYDLQEVTGRAAGTIGSWLEGAPMLQVEFLLSLLERLPEPVRHQLLDNACRVHPTLLHANLAHDPIAVDRLESILRQANGLTIIQGGQDYMRSFVLAALGNSATRVHHGKIAVYGLETHATPWTPTIGLTNTDYCKDGNLLKRKISALKSAPENSLILLGDDWWQLSGLGAEVCQLATRCNVVATDAPVFRQNKSPRLHPGPIQRLTISRVREQPEWLQIDFQSGTI
jgi:hypothetical protein